MGRQGFIDNGADLYVYQDVAGTASFAFGLDNSDGDKFKIAGQTSSGVTPSSTYQFSIDGSANGDIEFVPNGTGTVDATQATIRPDGATDAFIQFSTTTPQNFRVGIDRSTDSWKISQGTALGTNDTFIMNGNGYRTMPLNAAMSAYSSVNHPNTMGGPAPAGGQLNMPGDTEVFDQNNNYANPFFTAPVTGKYFFSSIGTVYSLNSSKSTYALNFNSAGIAVGGHTTSIHPFNARNGATGELTVSGGGMFFSLTAASAFTFTFVVGYGTMNAGVAGDPATVKTAMFGALMC